MVIDLTKCVGCDACTVACKVENQTPGDIWYAPVIQEEVGQYPNARMVFVPTLCMHCEDAPCVRACPTKALMRRDDGIVMYEEDKCCGSRACVTACPYDAAKFFEGETGEPVLGDPEFGSRLAHAVPKNAHLGHGQTAILGRDRGLSRRGDGMDFGNQCLLGFDVQRHTLSSRQKRHTSCNPFIPGLRPRLAAFGRRSPQDLFKSGNSICAGGSAINP